MSEFNLDEYLKNLQDSQSIDKCPKVPIPEIGKEQNYIFISYSHKDYKKVYSDLAHLYCQGVRFWYDKGLSAGEDWELEVKEHIQSPFCCGVIFYISNNMFLSDSIFKEINFSRSKKRPKIISRKSYFCVNLQNDIISNMLFDVQTIQRRDGMKPFDTKKLNILTSVFSDDDTYVKYDSGYHIDDLMEQIRNKFDVVSNGKDESNGTISLDDVKDSRIAMFLFSARETDPIPLFKFLYHDFKRGKKTRPWWLFFTAIAMTLVLTVISIYLLLTLPNIPFLSQMPAVYNVSLVLYACLGVPYSTAKLFWLFYISPIRHNAEKGPFAKIIYCIIFLLATLIMTAFVILVFATAIYLVFLLINYLTTKFA